MTVIYELEDVCHAYLGRFPALEDINIKIGEGERVALLGANGCGKSTLLQILDGLIFPETGEVRAFGTVLDEGVLNGGEFSRYFRRHVAMLFQNPDVQLFNSTVMDEIAFGPLQLDQPQEKTLEQVEDVLEMLEISHLRDRSPHTLSGGEKKKVALASMLAINPSVLLLDEPTNDLDPRTKSWLVDLLAELSKANKTIITATHDLPLVSQIATRVIVIGEYHQVVADGSSNEILGNKSLLLEANLIHEHIHSHKGVVHEHGHGHIAEHDHVH